MARIAEQMDPAAETGSVGKYNYRTFTLANDNYGIGLLTNIK
jgi:hypothetical protein